MPRYADASASDAPSTATLTPDRPASAGTVRTPRRRPRRHPVPRSRERHAVLVDAYPHLYYGAQRLTHLLARELPARGWTAEVVVPGPGIFVDRLRADGLPVSVVRVPPALLAYGGKAGGRSTLGPATALPVAWRHLTRVLRDRRAAVVHANDHRGALLAGPAARLTGAKLVWHVHYT